MGKQLARVYRRGHDTGSVADNAVWRDVEDKISNQEPVSQDTEHDTCTKVVMRRDWVRASLEYESGATAELGRVEKRGAFGSKQQHQTGNSMTCMETRWDKISTNNKESNFDALFNTHQYNLHSQLCTLLLPMPEVSGVIGLDFHCSFSCF